MKRTWRKAYIDHEASGGVKKERDEGGGRGMKNDRRGKGGKAAEECLKGYGWLECGFVFSVCKN